MADFLTVSDDDINVRIAASIKASEQELASYRFEQDMHNAAIADLGDIKWDDSNLEYRDLPRDTAIIRARNKGLSPDAIQKILDLQALDKHFVDLQSAIHECKKAQRIYDARLAALPAGPARDTAIAALSAK